MPRAESVESIQKEIDRLQARHKLLDETMEVELRNLLPDHAKVQRAKRLKLMYKDNIAVLAARRDALLAGPKKSADIVMLPVAVPASNDTQLQQAAFG